MSTYSRFHIFSTSFIGRVGRPFPTRYLEGLVSTLSDCVLLADTAVSKGIIAESGLNPSPGGVPSNFHTAFPRVVLPNSLSVLELVPGASVSFKELLPSFAGRCSASVFSMMPCTTSKMTHFARVYTAEQ